MKDKILHLLIVLFIFPALASAAPKEEKVTLLEAAACPGPFSVDFTKPELFTKKRFSFDDEGRAAAVDWLNELYEEKREFFEDVYNHPDKYYKEHHKTDE